MASVYLGELLGESHLLTLDMGGTSCDVAGHNRRGARHQAGL